MKYVLLGKTGLRVSRIALGTAAFGLPEYGIQSPQESGALAEAEAIRLVQAACEQGVTFFDTARGYGDSEAVLGKALKGCATSVVATKVSVPSNHRHRSPARLTRCVMDSLETSLRALRRDVLDVVQIHNATVQDLESGAVLNILERAREQGKVRFVGASVYGEEAAIAAIDSGCVDVLQVAINILDQRMINAVLPAAQKANVGIVSRSALLKGVLTERVKMLPPTLRTLLEATSRARETLGDTWESLPRTAIRFCLSVPGVHSVLVGLTKMAELPQALAAEASGPLSSLLMSKTDLLKVNNDSLLNPTHWSLPDVRQREQL